MANSIHRKNEKTERRAKSNHMRRRLLLGVSLAALLLPSLVDFDGLPQRFATAAETKVSQTITKDTSLDYIESNVSSVVFEGPYALTLLNGQTLSVAFTQKLPEGTTKKPTVVFGKNGSSSTQTWTIVDTSPAWIGVFNALDGSTLEVKSSSSNQNPLGKYTTASEGDFSFVLLDSGATLKLSAILKNNGNPIENEVKMGALLVGLKNPTDSTATVEVEAGQTLTVEDGIDVRGKLIKEGKGTLLALVNKYSDWSVYVKNASDGSYTPVATTDQNTTPISIDSLVVNSGTFRLANGTGTISDTNVFIDSISLGSEATLDVVHAGKITLTGAKGETVFSADDGAVIQLYVNEGENNYTSFVSDEFNTYMSLGAVTLDVEALSQKNVASEMTVFYTSNDGRISYDATKINVVDNLLGSYYVVDADQSDTYKLVLKKQDDVKFQSYGKTPNERSAGASIDSTISKGTYSVDQAAILTKLDANRDKVNFTAMTGEIYASTVGFMYMNNLTTTQTLMEHMRNKQLVAYSGDSSVAPMDYGTGGGATTQQQRQNSAAYYGGAAGGAFDQGPLYYNTDTNSYAPGVVPIYNNPGAGSYQMGYPSGGGYTGGVYNGETYSNGGYEYAPSGSAPVTGSSYNLGWSGALQRSTLATLRGQEAEYGDPGTLIYSAWATSIGGESDVKQHKDYYAYKGRQVGSLIGLDLFGSCDCRFGVFYGYQQNELQDKEDNKSKGIGLGGLKTKDHLLGLYHQYGDETVYNIAMIRAGYDRYETLRVTDVLTSSAALKANYKGYNAGASYERGANFAAEPFVFSPYASLDYNFLYRGKFSEQYATGVDSFANNFTLIGKKSMYHSLRGQLGGRVALDLYPASMQLRFVLRAAFIHEFFNPMYGETQVCYASFQDCDSYFKIRGNSMGRDWGLTGLGIDWAPIPCLVIAAKADCMWNKYLSDPYGSLGVKFRW